MDINDIATKQHIDLLLSRLEKMEATIEQLSNSLNGTLNGALNGSGSIFTKPLYTRAEAARVLHLHISTINKRVKDGTLLVNAKNKIPASELERFIDVCAPPIERKFTSRIPKAFLP